MPHDYTKAPLPTGPKGPFSRHTKDVTDIVLHYSWTLPSEAWPMSRIAYEHTNKRGFNGPGYHYLVRRTGKIEYGRPEWAQGAHVRSGNNGKIGICVEGGKKAGSDQGFKDWTQAQEDTVINLIREIKTRHRNAEITGHRDHVATQCPGFNVGVWWAQISHRPKPAPKPLPPQTPAIAAPKPLNWTLINEVVQLLRFVLQRRKY